MKHGIRSSIISLLAGLIAVIVYIWVRAAPEFSYFTWLSFYLAIASGLLSAHLLRIRLVPHLVFLPLFGWHLSWLLFHASNGNLNTLSLTHLSVIIVISTSIYFATKRRTRRSARQ
jgi:prepilin signal peptidase PulO-like enzyme (type II secretory pathway)